MGSTIRSTAPPIVLQTAAESIRWRSWPLVDYRAWSWMVLLCIAALAAMVRWMSDSWLFAAIVTVALAATLWQFLVPVSFEVTPLGVRRYALGRVRLVPWQAIRAYQLRSMGVVFFQCPAPSTVDVVNGLYVPYPVDEDEVIIALQQYLPHATEFVKGPTA